MQSRSNTSILLSLLLGILVALGGSPREAAAVCGQIPGPYLTTICPNSNTNGEAVLEWRFITGTTPVDQVTYEIGVAFPNDPTYYTLATGLTNTRYQGHLESGLPPTFAPVDAVCVAVRASYACGGAVFTSPWSQRSCCQLPPPPTATPVPTRTASPTQQPQVPTPAHVQVTCPASLNDTLTLSWYYPLGQYPGTTFEIGVDGSVLGQNGYVVVASGIVGTSWTADLGNFPIPQGLLELCGAVRAVVPSSATGVTTQSAWSAPVCCRVPLPPDTPTPLPTHTPGGVCPPTTVPALTGYCMDPTTGGITLTWRIENPSPYLVGWQVWSQGVNTTTPPVLIATVDADVRTFTMVNITTPAPACFKVRPVYDCQVNRQEDFGPFSQLFCCTSLPPTATPTPANSCDAFPPTQVSLRCDPNSGPYRIFWEAPRVTTNLAGYEIGALTVSNTWMVIGQAAVGDTSAEIPPILIAILTDCFSVRAIYECPPPSGTMPPARRVESDWAPRVCCSPQDTPTPQPTRTATATPDRTNTPICPREQVRDLRGDCDTATGETLLVWLPVPPSPDHIGYEVGIFQVNGTIDVLEYVDASTTRATVPAVLIDIYTQCFTVRAVYNSCLMRPTNAPVYGPWSRPFCCHGEPPTPTPTPTQGQGCDLQPVSWLRGNCEDSGQVVLYWGEPQSTTPVYEYEIAGIGPDGAIMPLLWVGSTQRRVELPPLHHLPFAACFMVRPVYACQTRPNMPPPPTGLLPGPWSAPFCCDGQQTPTPTPTRLPCDLSAPVFRLHCPQNDGIVRMEWSDPVQSFRPDLRYEIGVRLPGQRAFVPFLSGLSGNDLTIDLNVFFPAPLPTNIEFCAAVRAIYLCNGQRTHTAWSNSECCSNSAPTPTPNANAPRIMALTAYNSGVTTEGGGTVIFEAEVEHPLGLTYLNTTQVQLYLEGSPTELFMEFRTVNINGEYKLNAVMLPGAPSGDYILGFRALDGAGNQSRLVEYVFRVTSTATTRSISTTAYIKETYLKMVYPKAGHQFARETGITLAARVVDPAGATSVTSLDMRYNGESLGVGPNDKGSAFDQPGDGILSMHVPILGTDVSTPSRFDLEVIVGDGERFNQVWPVIVEID